MHAECLDAVIACKAAMARAMNRLQRSAHHKAALQVLARMLHPALSLYSCADISLALFKDTVCEHSVNTGQPGNEAQHAHSSVRC